MYRKNRIRLNESQLRRIVKESVKRVLNEHEDDWFDYDDDAYIGRTSAYYDGDDEDNVYTPDYWTYDNTPNSKDFAGEVYKLDDEGKEELNYWIRCQRFNEYQRRNAFNPREESSEEEWDKLTRYYGTRIR